MDQENKQLTLAELENIFNQAIGYDEQYIGVRVEMTGLESPEIIINPRENFEEKLNYYKVAYNDDLTLKNTDSVKITGFTYGSNFAEIQDWLSY